VAEIPVMLIVGHVEGQQVARCSDVATRGGGGATQRHCLSTCQPDGAPVLLEEDAASVTKLLFLRLITKGRKIIVCLFVGEEEDQAQELAVDAARGRHACRQESHVPVAATCVTIVADLVGSGALQDVVRVVGVAELALSPPDLTGAAEIMAHGDVHQQIGLLRHKDVADFEIGTAVALTREHPLVIGVKTGIAKNALQRPQDMVVRAGPIRSMMEAGVDVKFTLELTWSQAPPPPIKYLLQRHGTIRERSEGRVVGEPEELMEEGNIVPLRDCLRGARRIAAVCRQCAAHLAPN
jgi:hypothetical protein